MEDKICVQILDLIQFIILAAIKAIARLTASMIVELKNILAFPLWSTNTFHIATMPACPLPKVLAST